MNFSSSFFLFLHLLISIFKSITDSLPSVSRSCFVGELYLFVAFHRPLCLHGVWTLVLNVPLPRLCGVDSVSEWTLVRGHITNACTDRLDTVIM